MPAADESHVARHSGNVAGLRLTMGICLCYTLCVACLRGYIRWPVLGRDDTVVLVATLVFLAFVGVSYALAAAGLGRPIDQLDLRQPTLGALNQLILTGNLTWAIALSLSKVAMVTTLLRTTQTTSHQRAQYAAVVLIVAQGLVAIVILTAQCTSHSQLYWDLRVKQPTCPAKETRWLIFTILDLITEVILLLLPVHLVWTLRMSFRNKLVVVSAFWLRCPTLIFTVLRHRTILRLTSASDVSRSAAIVVIWQAVELSYSLAAVTIAALRRFTQSLNTGFGHGELVRVHGPSFKMSAGSGSAKDAKSSPSQSRKHAGTNVDTLTTNASEQELAPSRKPYPGSILLRPERIRSTTKITSTYERPHSLNRSLERNSEGSEDGIIRQQVQYSVHYGAVNEGRPDQT